MGLTCYLCGRVEEKFHFYDFQDNMLMGQACFGIVQFLLKVQTMEWWENFKSLHEKSNPKARKETVILSCSPKTEEEFTIRDVLRNKLLIENGIILTSGKKTKKAKTTYKNKSCKWFEWTFHETKKCN